ncbi:uncharacterized protein LOC135089975 [Scylla paramamosain]|uniref:uncharacterized protein LOC135089975 n=1 Tax=Scylla paramamosain TaxID=85552 RepID=UPI0030831B93
MRPEGRHHLVDIHGLAVFLRRSTRCLSCRAAFCLYVTGKISAQLAAVTQVKITCQKCNYTTSQTLSKPAGAPDSPSPPAQHPDTTTTTTSTPPTPPDTSTSPVRPPPPHCPGKPRHQTVIRLLKEENLTKKEAQKKTLSMPGLLPLQPIEKVWGVSSSAVTTTTTPATSRVSPPQPAALHRPPQPPRQAPRGT